MSRFTAKTEDQMRAEGWEPLSANAAQKYTGYGVPIFQKGMSTLTGSTFTHWAPTWACRLINEWPWKSSTVDDFDHIALKKVIIAIVKSGDYEMVDAVLTVARLGGVEAVLKMTVGQEQ